MKSIKASNLTALLSGVSFSLFLLIMPDNELGKLMVIVFFFLTGSIFVKGFNHIKEPYLKITLRIFLWFVGASSTLSLLSGNFST